MLGLQSTCTAMLLLQRRDKEMGENLPAAAIWVRPHYRVGCLWPLTAVVLVTGPWSLGRSAAVAASLLPQRQKTCLVARTAAQCGGCSSPCSRAWSSSLVAAGRCWLSLIEVVACPAGLRNGSPCGPGCQAPHCCLGVAVGFTAVVQLISRAWM